MQLLLKKIISLVDKKFPTFLWLQAWVCKLANIYGIAYFICLIMVPSILEHLCNASCLLTTDTYNFKYESLFEYDLVWMGF